MTLEHFKTPDQIELKFDEKGTILTRVFLQSFIGVKDGDQVVSQTYHRENLEPDSAEAHAALGAALQAALATVLPLQNQIALADKVIESLRDLVQLQASQLKSLGQSIDDAVESILANPAVDPSIPA